MNPTKPTPSLRERLDALASTYMLTQETPILDLLSAIIDHLEPVSNPYTLKEPHTCNWKELNNHGDLWCDECGDVQFASSAASPAGGGGTTSDSSIPGSSKLTTDPSDAIPTLNAGGAENPTPPTPAGEIPHFCLNPSVCRLCNPPAGEGRVPEWIETATEPACYTFRDTRKIADAVNALRADRDRWRERAGKLDDDWLAWRKNAISLHARIAELEAAQARQMTTIGTLTARHDKDEAMIASLEADLAAAKAQPKPADDWRERCIIDCTDSWHWYIKYPAKDLNWSVAVGWTKGCPKYYRSQDEARIALTGIPTPPPDEVAASPKPARKYPSVEQVVAWYQSCPQDAVFGAWLLDRAREQEGKGTITSKETAP
jgi:hypothetical protein